MRRRTKVILGMSCLLPVLVAAYLLFLVWSGPPGPRFVCHRGVVAAFEQWKLVTAGGGWYPNVEGSSARSLAAIAPYVKEGMSDYRYVPGLKEDDPADLILMYVREPTRRKWHGDARWYRLEKRWVVLNPQTRDGEGDRWSELAEWIPADEFTHRLGRTLQFLKDNNRPHWETVVREHSEFLESPKD